MASAQAGARRGEGGVRGAGTQGWGGVGAGRGRGVIGTSPWTAACGLLTSGASIPRDSSSPSGETTITSTGHFATLRNQRFFGPSGQMGLLSRTAAPGHMLLPNPLQAEGGHDTPSETERRKTAMTRHLRQVPPSSPSAVTQKLAAAREPRVF